MSLKKITSFDILIWPALFLLVAGCSGEGGQKTTTEQLISVRGELVTPVSKELTKTFTGSLEGEKQAVIFAKISEAVERINVREGERVGVDNILVSLDRSGPTSNYMQASSVFKNAEKNFRKMKNLFDQGAVSEMQYDGARTEYEVAKANFDAAAQTVDLRSPISGTVTSIDVSAGQYVSPGVQVATVAQIDKLRMKFGVSGNDIGNFKEGADVRVTVDADSLLTGQGNVIMVARSADPVTRTFQVDVEVSNDNHILKPGMFAKCEIIIGRFKGIVTAPRIAILNRDGKDRVFIYSGGKSVVREVVRGADFNGISEIKSGLNDGDTLITVGQDYVEDGGKVKLARFVGIDG
ncbi:MAG: efflux RND transporter periplasmic adaptor subunit, partial [candidate division Zixibacteria bacterium]|nr:efflux RND transporter periplasmic adaptor subunit [candidate division Zixibacteria bacterium]